MALRLCPILGLPGAGKTTLAQALASRGSFVRISAGDWLRERMRSGDEVASEQLRLNSAMDRTLFHHFLDESFAPHSTFSGSLAIDGSPRMQSQVTWLREFLHTRHDTLVVGVYLDLPPQLALERLAARPPRDGDSKTFSYVERIALEKASLDPTLSAFRENWPLLIIAATCRPVEILSRARQLLAESGCT